MGKHYVPRKYLKGFAAQNSDDKPLIWQFDKQSGSYSATPISIAKVAQQREFYDQETEDKITEFVEKPGNRVLDKLRSGYFAISDHDRRSLSIYAATMISRVPRNRQRGHDLAPQALTGVISELRELIIDAEVSGLIDSQRAKRRLAEADAAESKFSAEMPEEVIDQIKSPWPTENFVTLIHDMHWRFLRSSDGQKFLTGDNPAFYFECWGLGRPQSEFILPISTDLAILGCWVPVSRKNDLVWEHSQFVKECNRRIIVGATRFVFSHMKHPWVAKVSAKDVQDLSRFVA